MAKGGIRAMSYEVAVLWSIVRSLVVALVCVILAHFLVRWREVRRLSGEVESRFGSNALPDYATILLCIPFFMPGLVIGYAYRNAALSLVQTPQWNEALYALIVACQLLPVAVLVLEWLPPAPLSMTSRFCLRLASRSNSHPLRGQSRLSIKRIMVGEFPRRMTAGALVALLGFQEVEVATLMQAKGWPEWIFTKQVGGVELIDVAGYLVSPALYGLSLIAPVVMYWRMRQGWESSNPWSSIARETRRDDRTRWSCISWVALVIAWWLTVVWPLTSLVRGTWQGAGVISWRSAIWREIGDGLVLALTVSSALGGIMWWASRSNHRSFCDQRDASQIARNMAWTVVVGLLIGPGLLGSLVLSLAIFEICQRIGVSPAYSPWPLVVGMVLFLLPRAMALSAVWRNADSNSGVYVAQLMSCRSGTPGQWGQSIMWTLRDSGRFWTLAVLFWWSYLELTMPSLLRPAGMAPAPMRLYNFLHYGHIPGLAAMLMLVLAVPVVMVAIYYGAQRWRFRASNGYTWRGSPSDVLARASRD